VLPLFDIFSGHFLRKDAIWIEVCGSADAVQRMLDIAANKPGAYFLFNCYTRRCVMSVDTSSFAECDKAQPDTSFRHAALLDFIN